MRQQWRDLLFLHWEWDPDDLAKGLPDGLSIELHEGKAYLGVVPFFMRRVRPSGCPPIPWFSNFMELNVRTYVVDQAGRPGVWFYSLDCNQPVAVEVARGFFHLNYLHAKMSWQCEPDGDWIAYRSRRRKSLDEAFFRYRAGPVTPATAREGTLEYFLLERYALYAFNHRRDQVCRGEVRHHPYAMAPADVAEWSFTPAREDGFEDHGQPPMSMIFSPGVDVEVLPLRSVDP